MPERIGELTALQTLNVSSNKLAALPDSMKRLKSLKVLHANGNMLRSLPAGLAALPRLERVNVANNQIELLPAAVIAKWGDAVPALKEPGKTLDGADDDMDDADPADDGSAPGGAAGGAAGASGSGGLMAYGDKDFDDGDVELSVTMVGNPIVAGTGVGLAASQFTQPLTAHWNTKA